VPLRPLRARATAEAARFPQAAVGWCAGSDYPTGLESFDDVADQLPRFIDDIYNQYRLHSALGFVSASQFEQQHSRLMVKSAA